MRVRGDARRRRRREPVAGRITAASGGTTKVNVRTFGVAGAASDQPFHLIVAC